MLLRDVAFLATRDPRVLPRPAIDSVKTIKSEFEEEVYEVVQSRERSQVNGTVDIEEAMRNQYLLLHSIRNLGGCVFRRGFPGRRL